MTTEQGPANGQQASMTSNVWRWDPWRWPRKRETFPAHFVISHGWRQTAFYTPVVRKKCVITTIRFGKSARGFYGIAAARNEDDEPSLRIGLGFVEIDAYGMGFERKDDDDAE